MSEAVTRGSVLNDMAANIAQLSFDYLDAAPYVLGSQNWVTPASEYDQYFFPQVDEILDAINEKLLPLNGREGNPNFRKAEQLRKARLGV